MPIFTPRKHLSGIFLCNPEGKVLVIHRNKPELKWWEIIGGKVEPGEASRVAAKREAGEEANIVVTLGRRALYSHEFEHDNQLYTQDVWRARLVSGVHRPLEADHDEVAWMRLAELRQLEDVSPGLEYLIKQLVDGTVQISV